MSISDSRSAFVAPPQAGTLDAIEALLPYSVDKECLILPTPFLTNTGFSYRLLFPTRAFRATPPVSCHTSVAQGLV